MPIAKGPFEVKRTVHPPLDAGGETSFGAFRFDKQFHGDLVATSVVQMLSVGTGVGGSAAYVAVERIDGVLHGRKGTFAVHHTGVMNRGTPSLAVVVVPDSGTGELVGLSGAMTIDIIDGKHLYGFDYAIGA
jgi:hypothetical protein